MASTKSPAEQAARKVINAYVQEGVVSRATANRTIHYGLALVESTVRGHYRDGFGSALYYAGKVAEAREAYEAARGPVAGMLRAGRLMAAEMYAAVFAVVAAEEGPRDDTDTLTPDDAETVMRTVRDTAREVRDEAAARARTGRDPAHEPAAATSAAPAAVREPLGLPTPVTRPDLRSRGPAELSVLPATVASAAHVGEPASPGAAPLLRLQAVAPAPQGREPPVR